MGRGLRGVSGACGFLSRGQMFWGYETVNVLFCWDGRIGVILDFSIFRNDLGLSEFDSFSKFFVKF